MEAIIMQIVTSIKAIIICAIIGTGVLGYFVWGMMQAISTLPIH